MTSPDFWTFVSTYDFVAAWRRPIGSLAKVSEPDNVPPINERAVATCASTYCIGAAWKAATGFEGNVIDPVSVPPAMGSAPATWESTYCLVAASIVVDGSPAKESIPVIDPPTNGTAVATSPFNVLLWRRLERRGRVCGERKGAGHRAATRRKPGADLSVNVPLELLPLMPPWDHPTIPGDRS